MLEERLRHLEELTQAQDRELNMLRHTAARAIEEATRYEKLYEGLLESLSILKGRSPLNRG